MGATRAIKARIDDGGVTKEACRLLRQVVARVPGQGGGGGKFWHCGKAPLIPTKTYKSEGLLKIGVVSHSGRNEVH